MDKHKPTKIDQALTNIDRQLSHQDGHAPIPFTGYLDQLAAHPEQVLRNVFQIFHALIEEHIKAGRDEYPDDPESIRYFAYDCSRMFVSGSDRPFFADRLFANRLVHLAESLKRSAQQNKIYIFEGPHGSGKSTFLNNLLARFEAYANSEQGCRFEACWRLDRDLLNQLSDHETGQLLGRLSKMLGEVSSLQSDIMRSPPDKNQHTGAIDVPCPSHDNPILIVPKELRRSFIDDLIDNDQSKWKIFTEKEYEWVFKDQPCTICASLYQALLAKLASPVEVFKMLYARPYRFNRRLGEGISVFSPGDAPSKENVLTNTILQARIDSLLHDSNKVQYLYSPYAKTNNGIFALMDIKSHNRERLIELHNIISEGVHKVESIEENVNSMFIALLNPEDRTNFDEIQSFSDRIETIKIPYVLDLQTEVEIYRHTFGKHIDESFLPRILHNFARVIIGSRLNPNSKALSSWIPDPSRYRDFCDENLLLLKMEIYTGHIPEWLSTEDRKSLTAKRRRQIIAESEIEGNKGLSGRDALRLFNELFSSYARKDRLIDMAMLRTFFTRVHPELSEALPAGFLDSIQRMYDYTVLQEVRESIFYYNEEQISIDVQNYLYALNYEIGAKTTNRFTGQRIEITEEFLAGIENHLLGADASAETRKSFRRDTQREYTSRTLTQEIMVEGLALTDTCLYHGLYDRYISRLKEKALVPFLENENFRRAIKDLGSDDFKTYDKKIRDDVSFLIRNLCEKHRYTHAGAKEVSIYVIDHDLATEFSGH